ncbi:hypothetical protein [Maribacter luteus]|uniref:Uncharacterized protein n=1 Tax=Maribacter luteus TaxID=2594478 RepID=A0A6I2MQ33_9FLAO|nr:hypothetical protein [Maribacter luteus]MRX63316.1 hypothetical protein [Maribacter luteus]
MQQEDVNAINDTGGLPFRKKYYKNARKKDAFNIVRHYKDIYDNGTESQKEEAKAYFEKWKDDDEEAKKIVNEINAEAEPDNE